MCLWAGQFSSPAERRGALVISRLIGKTGYIRIEDENGLSMRQPPLTYNLFISSLLPSLPPSSPPSSLPSLPPPLPPPSSLPSLLPPPPSLHSDSTKLAEGLETPEFWSHLGGKARHHHFTPAEVVTSRQCSLIPSLVPRPRLSPPTQPGYEATSFPNLLPPSGIVYALLHCKQQKAGKKPRN